VPCYSPLKGFQDKETGGIVFKRSKSAGPEMEVACGQCLGCRLDRSRTWAMRIVHESSLYDDNCFITLTYDPEHLPRDGSLNKKHFQDFMKRLRKRFPDRRIRYYHCGEYGDQLERPHYHACLFNLQFPDLDPVGFAADDSPLFTSKILEDTWGKGFVTVGDLTFESAAYCARYILKKVNGARSEDHYKRLQISPYGEILGEVQLEPEYTTMSRGRPCKEHKTIDPDCDKCQGGIGRKWYERYKDDLWPSDEVPVPSKGVFKKVPRYYEDVLRERDPELHERIKAERQKFRLDNKEEYSPERLMDKYKVKKAQVGMLKRTV